MKKKLKKGVLFSDIHFGKKANSQLHNQDCIDYLTWFCGYVKKDKNIDYVAFLGDWNENRSALNIQTLNYSYQGAKMLNDLGLPVYFIVGNHDLYHSHTRELHSVIPFNEFSNFILIEEPTVVEEIYGKALFCPYMFADEYPSLTKYLNIPFWGGHFEFKGYEVTGYGMKMQTGPDAADFSGPDYIVSGHFHKRQIDPSFNVVYIGNTFPMDFGDADSNERGFMVYDHKNKKMFFENWEECPKYTKTVLSDLLDGTVELYPNSRVKCMVDIPVSFEESNFLRTKYTEDYNLREFTLEESLDLDQALTDTDVDIDWDDADNEQLDSTDVLVQRMLESIDSDEISNDTLVKIYINLQPNKNNKKDIDD